MSSDFQKTAKQYWTDERVLKLTGGKKWLILPHEAPALLRSLGLMNKDASISWDSMRKYSQINHMLQAIEGSLTDQAKRHPKVNILDAGCGTSFLSLAMAWFLKEKMGHSFRLVGIDSNRNVIETSRVRSDQIGLGGSTHFAQGMIPSTSTDFFPSDDGKNQRPHILIALHACDTATDHAIALGVKDKADIIAVAPCCQRELSDKIKKDHPKGHPYEPVFNSANIRREIAANLTDSMRLLHLRSQGYEVTASEFVPSEHTPKNRLLLAVRRGNFHQESKNHLAELSAHIGGHSIILSELLN